MSRQLRADGAARRLLRESLRSGFAREVVLVALAIVAYFAVRNRTVGSAAAAQDNAEALFELERTLGLAWEESLQGLVVGSDLLVTLTNWVYIWGHWPVILTVAVALFLTRRRHYLLLRNALFASGAIGFLFFWLLPMAPPRLAGLGLVDTVTEQSNAYRALQPPGLTNQFAAFPSLHVGWNILVGIVLFTASASILVRAFAIASPLAMTFAVVATANHFVLDVVGGLLVVLIGLAFASALQARRGAATLEADGVPRDGESRRRSATAALRGGTSRWQQPR